MKIAQPQSNRAFVILSVFIIVTLALLVVTGVLYLAQAETAARQHTAAGAQSRSLGWSAAQVVMNRLNRQREVILSGDVPTLDDQYELFRDGNRSYIVRLLTLDNSDNPLQPASAKLDINEINAETLAATEVVDSALAQTIIDHRDNAFGGRFRSIADIATTPGVEPSLVFGPTQRFALLDVAQRPRSESSLTSLQNDEAPPSALCDVVTVHGFEPAIQQSQSKRINLNVPWSQELGQRVNERFGDGAAQVLQQLFERVDFNEESKLIEVLIALNVDAEDWIEILDTLTTEAGEFHFGRVNINTASRHVLAALPGIEMEQAAQIVQLRDNLDADERGSIVWPLLQGILARDAYVELAGRITTRSWTYRLHLAGGHVDANDPDGRLHDPVIYEVVIDMSQPQPRIAYLRDVTVLQSAIALAADATARGQGIEPAESDIDSPESPSSSSGESIARNPSRPAAARNPARNASTPAGQPAESPSPAESRRRPGRWHDWD